MGFFNKCFSTIQFQPFFVCQQEFDLQRFIGGRQQNEIETTILTRCQFGPNLSLEGKG